MRTRIGASVAVAATVPGLMPVPAAMAVAALVALPMPAIVAAAMTPMRVATVLVPAADLQQHPAAGMNVLRGGESRRRQQCAANHESNQVLHGLSSCESAGQTVNARCLTQTECALDAPEEFHSN